MKRTRAHGSSWSRVFVSCYLALVVLAGGVAGWRLSSSTEMPGLAAIEVLVLALPWSLMLGRRPIAQADLVIAGGLVVLGLAINTGLVHWAGRTLEQLWRRHQPRGTAGRGNSPGLRWEEYTRFESANLAP